MKLLLPLIATSAILTIIATRADAQNTSCYQNLATEKADIVFLIDASQSIGKDVVKAVAFIKHLIQVTIFVGPNASRLTILTIGADVHKYVDSIRTNSDIAECELTAANGILNLISMTGATVSNDTVFKKALTEVETIFDTTNNAFVRGSVRKILFLLTDGHFDAGSSIPNDAERFRLRSGTEVFAIGVGGYTMPNVMKKMASEPKDCYYGNISTWQTRVSDLTVKLDKDDFANERNVTVVNPELCAPGCRACFCKEYEDKQLQCAVPGAATTPASTTDIKGATPEPSDPPVTIPCGPGGPEVERLCQTPTPASPSGGGMGDASGEDDDGEDDEPEEQFPIAVILIIVFSVINFSFFTMWCMFVWLWCCGFLDKQLGTTPPPDIKHMKRESPEGISAERPPVDLRRTNPPPPDDGREIYGNDLVGKVLDANKHVTVMIPEDGGHTASRPRRPAPPEPLSPGSLSNPGYMVPVVPDTPGGRDSYEEVNPDDEDSEDEDEYVNVNVADRFKGKFREIKHRFSGVFRQTPGDYENENEIDQIRQKHLERERKKQLKPVRKAPAKPAEPKQEIDKVFKDHQAFGKLRQTLAGALNPSFNREDSQKSSHSYLHVQ